MSNTKKSLLAQIKEMFNATVPPVAPAPAPAPALAPVQASAPLSLKLADGTDVSVDKMEVGGVMKSGDAPVVAGTYTMENGDVVTVGEGGVISGVVPKVAQAPVAPAPAAPQFDMQTPEGITAAYAKFAEGTLDLAGMNTILKALMEYSFGWQIREQQDKQTRDAAIAIYNEGLQKAQTTINNQEKMLSAMFSLMEQIVEAPADDAPVDPAKKKFSFSKVEGKNDYFKKMSDAMKKLNEMKKAS